MSNVKTRSHSVDSDEKLNAMLCSPTEIDNMNPNTPCIQILASISVSTRIPAHSIIAEKGNVPKAKGDDSVVTYRSAYIDASVFERVVRRDHSCQGQPEAIKEIRGILLEHTAPTGALHP